MSAHLLWWLGLVLVTLGPLAGILARSPTTRRYVWLLLRGRPLLLGSSVELFLSSMALVWGLDIANPWSDPLAGAIVFVHLRAIWPGVVWGTAVALGGATLIAWQIRQLGVWRARGSLVAGCWWAFLTVEVTWGAWPTVAPATPIYAWFAVWALWLSIIRDPVT